MRQAIFAILLLGLLAGVSRAERPIASGLGVNSSVSASEVKATPEMWFYEQAMRQHNDPEAAVRAKAELRTQQRQRRIESMKWFGLSNARPRANSDPYHGDYSPTWVSNAGYYPSRWNGVTAP